MKSKLHKTNISRLNNVYQLLLKLFVQITNINFLRHAVCLKNHNYKKNEKMSRAFANNP